MTVVRAVAHRVVERRHEIGVRLALGATPRGVVRMALVIDVVRVKVALHQRR